jgi:WD40 repeat protein
MIKIDRSRLQPQEKFLAIAESEARRAEEFYLEAKSIGGTFEFKAYQSTELRKILLELFHGKCAFCETPLTTGLSVEVEHFRPKHLAINLDGKVTKPGYWWLATEWSNLYPICSECNLSKGDRFPVAGMRAGFQRIGTTMSTLSQPGSKSDREDPTANVLVAASIANQKNFLYGLQDDGAIRVFNLDDQKSMRVFRPFKQKDEHFTNISCDGRGETLVAGTQSGTIFNWQESGGLTTSKLNEKAVTALQITPDGSKAAAGFADGKVCIWDRETGSSVLLPTGNVGQVNGVAITGNGKRMITVSDDQLLMVWNIESTPQVIFTREPNSPLAGIALSSDERKAVTLASNGRLTIWETSGWEESYYLGNERPSKSFHSLTVSGDGRYVVAISENRMHLYDLYLRREITPSVIFDKQSRLALIENDGRSIIRLDVANFFEIHSLDTLADENSLLLDPCKDDPEAFLIFREDGFVVSASQKIQQASLLANGTLQDYDRGEITIDVLGLNRALLVKQRQDLVKELQSQMTYLQQELSTSNDTAKIQSWLNDQFGGHQSFAALRRQVLGPMMEQLQLKDEYRGKLSISLEVQDSISQSVVQQILVESHKDVHAESLQKREKFSVEKPEPTDDDKALFFLRSGLVDEIHVVNYRPISELRFKFGPGVSERVGWKVLLGENAVGKSSLLEAVGLTLMGKKRFDDIVREEKLDQRSLLRRGAKHKQGFVHIYFSGDPKPVEMNLTPDGVKFPDPNAGLRCYVLGFGPARWLPKPGSLPSDTDPFVRIRNLFNPFVPLTNAIKWLSELHKQISSEEYRRVEDVLARLLLKELGTRFVEHKGAIYIVPRGCRVSNRYDRLDELSDGYQTILAIAAAIMQMLGGRWKYEMEAAEGLVLLDEIGEHLHPLWKLRIVQSMRSAFPRMQFLATTHEPLCLRGLYDNEILIMRRLEGRIAVYDNIPSPNTLTIDQLLTSPYFGMLNTFDTATEIEFKRYYEILSKQEVNRSADEKAELDILYEKLNADSLRGNSYRERLAIQAVDQLLAEKQATEEPFKPAELDEETKNMISEIWDELGENEEG